jgi:hypothetical protein
MRFKKLELPVPGRALQAVEASLPNRYTPGVAQGIFNPQEALGIAVRIAVPGVYACGKIPGGRDIPGQLMGIHMQYAGILAAVLVGMRIEKGGWHGLKVTCKQSFYKLVKIEKKRCFLYLCPNIPEFTRLRAVLQALQNG